MWQLGWEGRLGENEYMYMYGWIPSLFTRNYHNIVNQLLGACVLSHSIMSDSCNLMDLMELSRLLCPWDSPGRNTGVGCHFLLQGIFLTQELNSGLLHCRQVLSQLSYKGSPRGILLSHKKNEIMSLAVTWMDLKIIILGKVGQRKANILWYHSYVESNF